MRYFEKQSINRAEFLGQLGKSLGRAVGETKGAFKDVAMSRREFMPIAALKAAITVQKYSPTNIARKGLTGFVNELSAVIK